MEEELDLKELFNAFWSKKGLIILIILISVVIGCGYSFYYVVPEYKSKTTILLTKNESENDKTITQTDVTLNQQLVNTYTELIKTNNILNEVRDKINNVDITTEQLKESVEVKLVAGTQLIEISVINKDAKLAEKLTNTISGVFIKKMKEIYNMENLSIVDEAKEATEPYNINHKKDIVMFAIYGTVLAFGIVFVISCVDKTIKNPEVIEKQINVTNLANIPKYIREKNDKNELVIQEQPKSPIAEVFRMLRTNLQFVSVDNDSKTILVTSSNESEGKSFITSNLAISFAKEGKKILLIDADMRKGRLSNIFEINRTPGLANYLSGISDFEDKDDIHNYIIKTNIENISILPAGDIPPNPSELLETSKLLQLIEKSQEEFDLIIFDGTPCLLVADSIIIAKHVETTLVVCKYKGTKTTELEKTIKTLKNVNAKICGFIVNQIPYSKKMYDNSYYYGKKESK